ncbi:MAG: hypothetical protein HY074_13565 [Deltaproteobacteria bacterium]|nr:hypothetical protein [Deltaproteobacteria bacterium]
MRDKKPAPKNRLRLRAQPRRGSSARTGFPPPAGPIAPTPDAANSAVQVSAPAASPDSPSPLPTASKPLSARDNSLFDRALRVSKTGMHILTLVPLYLLASVCIGVSLVPGAWLFSHVSALTAHQPELLHLTAVCIAGACGFFLYGFTLILVLPLANFVLRARVVPWRGHYYSAGILNWYVHNALIYLARYTFLEFVTPTPLNLLFYKLMGMHIGQGTQINSVNISDAALVTLGERVTIGGSATIVAHYGMGGVLIISPVNIGNGATIGLKATIMGGVEIGEGAKVMPNSVVLPRTKIPAGETWGGVPARKIELRKAA